MDHILPEYWKEQGWKCVLLLTCGYVLFESVQQRLWSKQKSDGSDKGDVSCSRRLLPCVSIK